MNTVHGVHSIQYYVIKFVSDLRQEPWFPLGSPVSSTNKTDRHHITEHIVESGVKYHNHKHNPIVFYGIHVSFILFVKILYNDVQHDFYIRWCSCRLTVTRQVSQVEQELSTLYEQLSSLSFFGVRVARSFFSV